MKPQGLNVLTLLWGMFFFALIVGIAAQVWWSRRKNKRGRGFPVGPERRER